MAAAGHVAGGMDRSGGSESERSALRCGPTQWTLFRTPAIGDRAGSSHFSGGWIMADNEAAQPEAAAERRVRAPAKPRKRVARRRVRKQVRWSARREEIFLAALGETGNVAGAARASELSVSNVYRRRRQHEEFRTRWAAALREGYAKLEAMLLDRAINGIDKPVWHGGKQVGTIKEYSDRLALALLTAHRGTVTGAPGIAGPGAAGLGADELDRRLAERLSVMNIGMGGDG